MLAELAETAASSPSYRIRGGSVCGHASVPRPAAGLLVHQPFDDAYGRAAVAEELLVEVFQVELAAQRLLALLAQFHDFAVTTEVAGQLHRRDLHAMPFFHRFATGLECL